MQEFGSKQPKVIIAREFRIVSENLPGLDAVCNVILSRQSKDLDFLSGRTSEILR